MNKLSTTPNALQTFLCSTNFLLTSTSRTRIYSPSKQFFVCRNNQRNEQCQPSLARRSEGIRNNKDNMAPRTAKCSTEKLHRQQFFVYINNQRHDEQNWTPTRWNDGSGSIQDRTNDETRCREEWDGMRINGIRRGADESNRTHTEIYATRAYGEMKRILEESRSCHAKRRFDGTRRYGISEGIRVGESILNTDERQRQICAERRQCFHFVTSNNDGKSFETGGDTAKLSGKGDVKKKWESLERRKSFPLCTNDGNRRHVSVSAIKTGKNDASDATNKRRGGDMDAVGNESKERRNETNEHTRVDARNAQENRADETGKQPSSTRSQTDSISRAQTSESFPQGQRPTRTYSDVGHDQDVSISSQKGPDSKKNVFESAHKEFDELLKGGNAQQTTTDQRLDKIKGARKSTTGSEASGRGSLQIGSQFVTQVRFSYEDLISFGKLSRDWNPIHYYPDDGRVEHLANMFRIKPLDEIQETTSENSAAEETPSGRDRPLVTAVESGQDLVTAVESGQGLVTAEETGQDPVTGPIVPGALLNNIVSGIIGSHLPGPGTLIISQTLDYKARVFVDETVRFRVRVVNVRKMLVGVSYKAWVRRHKEGVGEEEKIVVMRGDAKLVYRR